MTRRTAAGLLVAVVLLGVGGTGAVWWKRHNAWRQSITPPPPPTAVGEITEVAPNLYLVPGGGGNSAVFVAAGGVVIVDAKSPSRGEDLLAQVRRITDKPIRYVINTHSHDDHTGGNDVMPASAEIVVQEHTAANIQKMRRKDGLDAGRPLRTFSDRLTLFEGDDAVDLYYCGAAHTDGDALVVFRRARVMHAGDMFIDKTAPIINLPWGGNPAEYVTTMARASSTIHDVDRVITGHGPMRTWDDFVTYGEFIRTIVTQAKAAKDAGIDANAARRQLVLPPAFADYKLDRLAFTYQDIYKGFTPWWHVW